MTGFDASRQHFERASQIVPAGTSTNTRARQPHPLYFTRAEGAWVWDGDGNRHLDMVMGNGAVLLGHGHEAVTEAAARAVSTGLTCGVESPLMIDAAEALLAAASWPDMVRFTNTGTEAVQHALHIARHATGRRRIAKVEGSYHGWSDEVFVSVWFEAAKAGPVTESRPVAQFAGQRQDLVDEVVLIPFNDIAGMQQVLDRLGGDLAAIILEPTLIDIGFVPGRAAYLRALKQAAEAHGIVLIFDELLTGFNLAPGGAAELTGVAPDLALYGKAIANGFPLAAVAGREALMRMTEPGKGPAFVGTFNGHAVSVAVAAAVLPILGTGEVQALMAQRNARLADTFQAGAHAVGIQARMVHGGSHCHWYFLDDEVADYRSAARTDASAYARFIAELGGANILTLPNPLSHHAISVGHGEDALEHIEAAFSPALSAAAG